jgi:mRNA interferase HigB
MFVGNATWRRPPKSSCSLSGNHLFAEATAAEWKNPADLKRHFASASVVAGSWVVFNISGNRFRLVVAVNYAFGVVDIRFFGTHAEYDRIDVESI